MSNVSKHIDLLNTYLDKLSGKPERWSEFHDTYLGLDKSEISNDLDDKNQLSIRFLDLSNEKLETVPNKISLFKNLEILDLSANRIKHVTNILKLKNLKVLILDLCQIRQVDIMDKLPDSLLMLSMSFCHSGKLINKKNKNNKLLYLNLSANSLDDLQFVENNAPELIMLDASSNQLKEFPLAVASMPNLKILDLDSNAMSSMDNVNVGMPSIFELSLLNNRLKNIPDSIRLFTGLKNLHLQANPIESISPNITRVALEHLCATVTTLNASNRLFEITSIKDLNIDGGSISEIPDSIGGLTELRELSLNKNTISHISEKISLCKNLKTIRLNDNHLAGLPESFGKLSHLTQLDLGNNLFDIIPDSIFELLNLEVLIMQRNYISEIPVDIAKLSSLKMLIMSRNVLSSIPSEIGELRNLSSLMVDGNKLEFLPVQIGKLINLEDIALDRNNLLEYPCELADLHKLNKMYAYKNDSPLTNMPDAKGLGLVQLFEYLNQKRGRAKYAVEWDVPTQLRTAFQQYMNFFTDYVLALTGSEVILEVNKTENGLKLTTQTTSNLPIEAIDEHLTQFVNYFIRDNTAELDSILEHEKTSRQQAFQIRQIIRDLKFENRSLRDKIQGQLEKIVFLAESNQEKNQMIADLNFHLRFFTKSDTSVLTLKPSPTNFSDINVNVTLLPAPVQHNQLSISSGSDESFLADLLDKAARMLERKRMEKLEDLHNNDFAHFFRDRYYYVTDQTQSGIANSNMGELDIMIRKANGTPVSIIEAFKLASCGEKNAEISSHIDKLLHNYDTAGLQTNYVVVYALSKKFDSLWNNYVSYIRNLNDKPEFNGEHHLVSFVETAISSFSDVKVGLAIHKRNGSNVRVYHVFINMYSA